MTSPPASDDAPDMQTGPKPYADQDLVYVDPETKTVVGKVEWTRNGNPRSLPYRKAADEAEPAEKPERGKDKDKPRKERRGPRGRKHYPFGTYRSMKGAFKLEGKQKKTEAGKTLDEVIEKALTEPFWD